MRLGPFILALALTGFPASAASVGPDYSRPAPSLPSAYAETSPVGWKRAEPGSTKARGFWWQVFGDQSLNRLEDGASHSNLLVSAAIARLEQARAQVDVTRADFWPSVDFTGGATRQRASANQSVSGPNSTAGRTYNNFSLGLNLGWELDLWGRVRRGREAAIAQLRGAEDGLASLRLMIEAETASDYFALRALDSDLSLLRSNLVTQTRALELVQNRRKGGLGTDLDVAEAETRVRTTEAQLPASELSRTRLLNALATLTGTPAGQLSLDAQPLVTPLPVIGAGLPSELLERRPDVASAEQRVIAANAQVGIAKAAYFPTFRLGGLAGLDSVNAATVFDWPSRVWSVGPSVTLPLFEGKRISGRVRGARAALDESIANYRQTVLTAIQEVEDNLAAQRLLGTQQQSEELASASARRASAIALNRYQGGLTTYLDVSTAMTAQLERERAVVELQGQRFVAAVALVKALGGGWENGQPPELARTGGQSQ
ncbi:MAG TPA: efflux transporter outer membrane subunit [Candidatus Limnocylindria bacterium]|nr:efflux transporter outer membrane subunit [Candidatus Limnocylindria bacterium]